jgi:hypothetical protein
MVAPNMEHAASVAFPSAPCVIPSLSGGWIEIAEARPETLEMWAREHGFDPNEYAGRPVEDRDLVGYFLVQAPERPLLAPIAWPYETQNRFVHFLANIARMTFDFPQRATFSDVANRITIDAVVSVNPDDPRRRHLVQFKIHASSALSDKPLDTELTVQQEALPSIVRSCCHHFPGLNAQDWESAWT